MMSKFGTDLDHLFMGHALQEAQKAFDHQEVPIGAVIVDAHAEMIGRSYNRVESLQTQTAHAEMGALEDASKNRGSWRLEGCWIFVTLEPCAMCMGCIRLSRLEGVVFATASHLFGYRIEEEGGGPVSRKVQVVENVRTFDSTALLKQFFQQKRKHHG